MRTNLTLDTALIGKVQKYTGCKTKSKAVVIAIEDFLRWQRIESVKTYKGKLRFRSDTATARKKAR